ncbi:GerMN domain-containing protein [Agromyces albus]|uniref:GerMN domain-containing protein n=1 Tax=Agromyces albus TaxID=205332 RepID=A0A4Q2KUV3_9MICO|nr:LpqB family beta-propeller domain-containing protein [Agromyces albus]RXZ67201.1 hypothetical protein ESP51_18750 [Agromyces albus]
MRRRLFAASVAIMSAVMLAGCVSIPSSGAVNAGNSAVVDEDPEFDIIAPGPIVDGTPEQIVQGFMDAAVSPGNNYRVARQFLTPAFADEWQADAAATIYTGARRPIAIDESSMIVEVTPVASLTAGGQYAVTESRAAIPLPYRLEQVDGQWRISEAPPGVVIDEANFASVFRKHALYYFDPEYRYLVPDVRWFAGRDSVQTSIVKALLTGPAEWLAPGVVSAFPDGVRLDPDAVPVDGTVASVDLSGAAFDDLLTVQRMQEQLDASLVGKVRNVSRVTLSLNGLEQDVPDLPGQVVVNPRVAQRPVVYDGASFGYLATSGESIDPIPGLSAEVETLAPTGAALGPDAESAAVRSAGGVSLVLAGEAPVLLDPRADLVVPAIDGAGYVWSVPRGSPDQLVVFAPDGTDQPLDVPWGGSSIAAIEVSRDSTRLIALVGDGARTQFVVASIQRDTDGRIALGPMALRLDDTAGTPLDVAWLDASNVASLTALPDGTTRLVTQEIGGFASDRQGPDGGVLLDGGNSITDIRVLTSAGALNVRSGVGWQARTSDLIVRFTAVQQPN